MRLAADLIDRDAHKEFRRFFNNTGQITWEKKIAKIDGLSFLPSPSPNLYRKYLANRNPLTSVIAAFLKMDREGKQFRKHANTQLMMLVSQNYQQPHQSEQRGGIPED